jgi:hypothetical protein
LNHLTKPEKYSVKSLSSVTLGKEVSVNCTLTTTYLSSTFVRHSAKTSLPSATWFSAKKSHRHGAR